MSDSKNNSGSEPLIETKEEEIERLRNKEIRLLEALNATGMTPEERKSYNDTLVRVQDRLEALKAPSTPQLPPSEPKNTPPTTTVDEVIAELQKRNLVAAAPATGQNTLQSASMKQICIEVASRIRTALNN